MNKKIIALLTVATLVVGMASAGTIYAQAQTTTGTSLAERIAQRFNLDQTEVQAVFDEHREEIKVVHKEMMEEKLNKLVNEGKLTEDQKNALLQKMEETRVNKGDFANLSEEERRTKMQEHAEEFRIFLEENGIDESVIGMGFRMGKFKGGDRMMIERN